MLDEEGSMNVERAHAKPLRTVMFVAGSDLEEVEQARHNGSDAVIVDLEEPRTPFPESERVRTRAEISEFFQNLRDDADGPLWFVRVQPIDTGQTFYNQLQLLAPKTDAQVAVKAAAISAAIALRRTYWLMFLGSEGSSLSRPLLLVVVAWLTAIFISFGLFAPRNDTVFVTLVVCAVAVSGAIFIIMAMYSPFSGVMKISSLPLRDALIRMTP